MYFYMRTPFYSDDHFRKLTLPKKTVAKISQIYHSYVSAEIDLLNIFIRQRALTFFNNNNNIFTQNLPDSVLMFWMIKINKRSNDVMNINKADQYHLLTHSQLKQRLSQQCQGKIYSSTISKI